VQLHDVSSSTRAGKLHESGGHVYRRKTRDCPATAMAAHGSELTSTATLHSDKASVTVTCSLMRTTFVRGMSPSIPLRIMRPPKTTVKACVKILSPNGTGILPQMTSGRTLSNPILIRNPHARAIFSSYPLPIIMALKSNQSNTKVTQRPLPEDRKTSPRSLWNHEPQTTDRDV